MSGTSLDGIDAVLVDCSGPLPRTLATHWQAYDDATRQQALALQAPLANELHATAILGNVLARQYASATAQVLRHAGVAPSAIAAIGCHGQTVRHQPALGYSVQVNSPALLAELTGISVVADFRSRDIAAGGQGAPLVPAFHAAVFGDPHRRRVILNLGGIANLTALLPDRPVTGFDSGPGNLLMDAWIEHHQGRRHDENGKWAASGSVLPALLEALLSDRFFAAMPPKSCGRDDFHLPWLKTHLRGDERPEDVQATLLELTATSATQAIAHWCGDIDELFVCGGGVHNGRLMARLAALLPERRVASTDFLGQPPDWLEAVAFAWLAWRTLNRESGNLPEVTGARGARILGSIYPA